MEHVAVMRKSWGLTGKLVTGQKKIESRWYRVKYAPWGRIKPGETVYFKNSGEPVTLKAEVEEVLLFSGLTPDKVLMILERYGKDDGIEEDEIPRFFEMFREKRYCMLVFLRNVQAIAPFEISKRGFGAMSSWICVDSIEKLKKG